MTLWLSLGRESFHVKLFLLSFASNGGNDERSKASTHCDALQNPALSEPAETFQVHQPRDKHQSQRNAQRQGKPGVLISGQQGDWFAMCNKKPGLWLCRRNLCQMSQMGVSM